MIQENNNLVLQLVYLNLSFSNIKNISFSLNLPNLVILDLSHNEITLLYLNIFTSLHNLKKLVISNNPILEIIPATPIGNLHPLKLTHFEAKGLAMNYLDFKVFLLFENILHLQIAGGKFTRIGIS